MTADNAHSGAVSQRRILLPNVQTRKPASMAEAMEAGFRVCTLGSRILRCETAPLCALSAVMYAAGEF